MNRIITFFLLSILLNSCSNYYKTVPLSSINPERKEAPKNFAETYLNKCVNKDYMSFVNINIAKKFEKYLVSDSLKKSCDYIENKFGNIKNIELVSVHTNKRPADFIDVFNYKIDTEKLSGPFYLHIGVYRDKNYIELPFYLDQNENYLASRLKKYRQNKKKK